MIYMNKRYRTKNGDRVRLYATDGGTQYPVHGAIWLEGIGWKSERWTDDGGNSEFTGSLLDLVEISAEEAFAEDLEVARAELERLRTLVLACTEPGMLATLWDENTEFDDVSRAIRKACGVAE